jgi:hypothetical protein
LESANPLPLRVLSTANIHNILARNSIYKLNTKKIRSNSYNQLESSLHTRNVSQSDLNMNFVSNDGLYSNNNKNNDHDYSNVKIIEPESPINNNYKENYIYNNNNNNINHSNGNNDMFLQQALAPDLIQVFGDNILSVK